MPAGAGVIRKICCYVLQMLQIMQQQPLMKVTLVTQVSANSRFQFSRQIEIKWEHTELVSYQYLVWDFIRPPTGKQFLSLTVLENIYWKSINYLIKLHVVIFRWGSPLQKHWQWRNLFLNIVIQKPYPGVPDNRICWSLHTFCDQDSTVVCKSINSVELPLKL